MFIALFFQLGDNIIDVRTAFYGVYIYMGEDRVRLSQLVDAGLDNAVVSVAGMRSEP